MFNFKDFNITTNRKGYEGDKIKIERLFNREIIIHEFKIEDSTQEIGTKCLHLQISINDIKYVVFTGGKLLLDDIQKIPENGFPFKTTIVKVNSMFKFT